MTGIEAREMIEHLSVQDARDLMLRLRVHIQNEEASMTPLELHEHLKEVPDQLFRDAQDLSWDMRREMRNLVADYVVRHGDWTRDEYVDGYIDDDGELNTDQIHVEFYDEIGGLTDDLLDKFFAFEDDDN